MRRTQEGIRENYRLGLEASPETAARLTRRLFFEYGRATIDTWRLRSEASLPASRRSRRTPACSREAAAAGADSCS